MYEYPFGKTLQVSILEAGLECTKVQLLRLPNLQQSAETGHRLCERRDSALLQYLFAQEHQCELSELLQLLIMKIWNVGK